MTAAVVLALCLSVLSLCFSAGLVGGKLYREYTLVIFLSDTDLKSVHAAADEMLSVFDQSSVLIQANTTVTEFYSGN